MAYRPGRSLTSAGTSRALGLLFWAGFGITVAVLCSGLGIGAWSWAFAIGIPVAYTQIRKSRMQRYDIEAKHGLEALRQGSPTVAEREFGRLRDEYRWPRFLVRLSDYNRAQALFRQGRHAESIALLAQVDANGGIAHVDPAIAATLAYEHALCGEVELADQWLDEARRRYARFRVVAPFPYILSETSLALRRGEAAEVRKRLDDEWAQIESQLTGERLRPLRFFRAFAIAQSSDPREAGAVAPQLAALQATKGEFDYLATQWPELQQFIATNLR